MKKINILYWVFNGLFAAFMLFSALPDVFNSADAVQFMNGLLGYPRYIIPFIGVAKVLGAIAILVPGFHRIKEWAYAGFAIDLAGATYSVMSVGMKEWPFNLIFIAFFIVSYYLYVRRKKMQEEARLSPRGNGGYASGAMA